MIHKSEVIITIYWDDEKSTNPDTWNFWDLLDANRMTEFISEVSVDEYPMEEIDKVIYQKECLEQ